TGALGASFGCFPSWRAQSTGCAFSAAAEAGTTGAAAAGVTGPVACTACERACGALGGVTFLSSHAAASTGAATKRAHLAFRIIAVSRAHRRQSTHDANALRLMASSSHFVSFR